MRSMDRLRRTLGTRPIDRPRPRDRHRAWGSVQALQRPAGSSAGRSDVLPADDSVSREPTRGEGTRDSDCARVKYRGTVLVGRLARRSANRLLQGWRVVGSVPWTIRYRPHNHVRTPRTVHTSMGVRVWVPWVGKAGATSSGARQCSHTTVTCATCADTGGRVTWTIWSRLRSTLTTIRTTPQVDLPMGYIVDVPYVRLLAIRLVVQLNSSQVMNRNYLGEDMEGRAF